MDLCGPMSVASINGKRYILVIVDDYSRFTRVRFLKTKDEAPVAIIKCIKNIQVRLNTKIRNVRTDNGTEFVNQTLREWYENVGISHQTSVARTLQQNGVVERRNWTLVEAARTMLMFSKAPLFLWAEAINTACFGFQKVSVSGPGDLIQHMTAATSSYRDSTTTPAAGIIIREAPVETKSKRKEKERVDVAHGKGIELFSDVALTEEAQMKEVRMKSLRDI
ncbi:retrovirus-related pol polyprotein from transposon TNT 1-94 [Tanacetum coccineum]